MNYKDIIVFDFETGSRNPEKTQPIQIAAVAIHGRKLTVQPDGYFESLIRPILDDEEAISMGLDPIEDEALAVNGKTREEIAKAPSERSGLLSLRAGRLDPEGCCRCGLEWMRVTASCPLILPRSLRSRPGAAEHWRPASRSPPNRPGWFRHPVVMDTRSSQYGMPARRSHACLSE